MGRDRTVRTTQARVDHVELAIEVAGEQYANGDVRGARRTLQRARSDIPELANIVDEVADAAGLDL